MTRHHSNYLVLFTAMALTSSCSLFAPTDDDLFGKQAKGDGGASASGGAGTEASGGASAEASRGGRSSTVGTGRIGGTTSTSKS